MPQGETTKTVSEIEKHWEESLGFLKNEVDPQVYAAFLKPLTIDSFNQSNGELKVNAPSNLVRNHVSKKFSDRLHKALADHSGNPSISVKFSVGAEAGETVAPYVVVKKVKSFKGVKADEDSGSDNLNARYSFDSFVVGKNSDFCHAVAKNISEKPAENYNPLFIYGGVGLGKTHLLHAIGNHAKELNNNLKVHYTSSENFTNELINSLRRGNVEVFKKHLRSINLLLIDDIQFIAGKERTQEEFFHTFNALYEAKNQIVITCDKLPQEIPGIEERLKTRFSWGVIADLKAPDYETRVAILTKMARAGSLEIPIEVSKLIAKSIRSNVRELEGAFNRLQAVASLRREPVSVELAESALKELLRPKRVCLSLADIKSAVSHHFQIKVSDICSKRRTRNISLPRHVAMYLCRKHTTASYPEIGHAFGGRDHSSVIHAANVITKKYSIDENIKHSILEIEGKLFNI